MPCKNSDEQSNKLYLTYLLITYLFECRFGSQNTPVFLDPQKLLLEDSALQTPRKNTLLMGRHGFQMFPSIKSCRLDAGQFIGCTSHFKTKHEIATRWESHQRTAPARYAQVDRP